MRILYTRNPLVNNARWQITAHSCGKLKWHSFTSSLSRKGKMFGLDIVSQNVPFKTNYWTKIADLGTIFLRSYLILWYQLLHPHIVRSMPFHFFFLATVYSGPGEMLGQFRETLWSCVMRLTPFLSSIYDAELIWFSVKVLSDMKLVEWIDWVSGLFLVQFLPFICNSTDAFFKHSIHTRFLFNARNFI